jgi:hypothetical protein
MTFTQRHITRLMLPALYKSANAQGSDVEEEFDAEDEDRHGDLVGVAETGGDSSAEQRGQSTVDNRQRDRTTEHPRSRGRSGSRGQSGSHGRSGSQGRSASRGRSSGRYSAKSSAAVAEDILETLYNECVYAAAKDTIPSTAGHWPVSYSAEMDRIRKEGGRLSFGTVLVAGEDIERFGDRLMEYVRQYDWGQGAFFLHQLRGTRGQTAYNYLDSAARDRALENFFYFLDFDEINREKWYVDWGVELQLDGYVLWWRRDSHWRLVASTLSLDAEEANELTKPSSKFFVDPAAQMTDVAGFRFVPSATDRGNTHVHYVQAYNTEKSITYLLDGNKVAKGLGYKDTFVKKDAVENYMMTIGSMFGDAEMGYDGYARLERRVRVDHALEDFFPTDPEQWAQLVIAFDRAEWW